MDPTVRPHADEVPERQSCPGNEIDYDVMVLFSVLTMPSARCPRQLHAIAATHINIPKNVAFFKS